MHRELKKAREEKGLSQRELAGKVGVPQGHISKTENCAVDLRLSSLVGLARALDLELALVPREFLPAVKSLAHGSFADVFPDTGLQVPRPLYSLDGEGDD